MTVVYHKAAARYVHVSSPAPSVTPWRTAAARPKSTRTAHVDGPPRTSKPCPVYERRWEGPARTLAHRERRSAHRERKGAHSERPAAYAA